MEQALRSVQLIQKPPIHLFLLHSFLGLKWVSVLKESEKKIDRDFDTCAKGQKISKANYGILNSSKERTKKFIFTTMRLVFVRFLEEIDDLKKPFRN